MKQTVCCITVTLYCFLCTVVHGATSATSSRPETFGNYSYYGMTGTHITIPPGIKMAPVNDLFSSEARALRMIYIPTDQVEYWSMASVPACRINGPTSYTDSTGSYSVTCSVKVRYYGETEYIPYNRVKAKKVIAFAVDTIWAKNGVPVNPATTLLPGVFDGKPTFTVYGNNTTPISGTITIPYIEDRRGRTVLGLNIDDIVTATSDGVVINYSWSVSPGADNVSSIYSKMYMEQLDSNIEMAYVKPDGSGSTVIVPNNVVVLEDTSKRLASNGQIKLRLDSKTGFGTKSSRLRVTVEWQ